MSEHQEFQECFMEQPNYKVLKEKKMSEIKSMSESKRKIIELRRLLRESGNELQAIKERAGVEEIKTIIGKHLKYVKTGHKMGVIVIKGLQELAQHLSEYITKGGALYDQ